MHTNIRLNQGVTNLQFKASSWNWVFLLILTMVGFSNCAPQRDSFGFAIDYNNFDQKTSMVNLSSIANTPILSDKLVFEEDYQWIFQAEKTQLPDSVANTIRNLELILFWSEDELEQRPLSTLSAFNPLEESCSCIGRLLLSDSYESYLILFSHSFDDAKNLRLYLLNTINNRIVSMVLVSHYAVVNSNSYYMYTIRKRGNKYVQQHKTLSTDVIKPKRFSHHEIIKGHTFSINDAGNIILMND